MQRSGRLRRAPRRTVKGYGRERRAHRDEDGCPRPCLFIVLPMKQSKETDASA